MKEYLSILDLLEEIKKEDPETAITEYLIRSLVRENKVKYIKEKNKYMINTQSFFNFFENELSKNNNTKDNRYYMYKHDSFENWKKWWTTDVNIIKDFKRSHTYTIIGLICSLLTLLAFIGACVFGGLGIIAGIISSITLIIVCMFATIGFFNISQKLFDKAESNYFTTPEYRYLKNNYDKEQLEEINARRREKSKKLVEAYDILDNKNLSKEERIELLKDYVDWRN